MDKRVIKPLFFIFYLGAAGVIAYFIPHQIKFVVGFLFGWLSVWGWKVLTNNKLKEEFIGCTCTPNERPGETSIMCCNICGKPTEEFWTSPNAAKKYAKDHNEFVSINKAERELQWLKQRWERLHLDLPADDFLQSKWMIQDEVIALQKRFPMVVTDADMTLFRIKRKEVNNA